MATQSRLRELLEKTAVGKQFDLNGITYRVVRGANKIKRAVWVRPRS